MQTLLGNIKEYIDQKLREAVDEYKAQTDGKPGNNNDSGKSDATGGSGQAAAVSGRNDAGKGAGTKPTAGTERASKPEGKRPRGGTDADAVKADLPYEPSAEEISRYVDNIRNHQSMDFEYKTMPVASVKPSQSGEDYNNDSSKETARIHKQYKPGDDIGYRGDFMPVVVDENNNIIDGNHRHAAHTMNGCKNMRVLVAKKDGTGKITGLSMQKSLDVTNGTSSSERLLDRSGSGRYQRKRQKRPTSRRDRYYSSTGNTRGRIRATAGNTYKLNTARR